MVRFWCRNVVWAQNHVDQPRIALGAISMRPFAEARHKQGMGTQFFALKASFSTNTATGNRVHEIADMMFGVCIDNIAFGSI
jgi:hypothetical protein